MVPSSHARNRSGSSARGPTARMPRYSQTTCAEVRRIVAKTRPPQPRDEPKDHPPTGKNLEAPPMIFDPDGFEYGEE